MSATSDDFTAWIGRNETVADGISPATAQAAAAMFDEQPDAFAAGGELPPLWHWFYFLPKTPQGGLGSDGHPSRQSNSFMPPIPYPRRMFAGARLTWHRPLVIGQPARRDAEIREIVQKSGRSGALAFVTVACRYYQSPLETDPDAPVTPDASSLCLEEEQDIVYRQPGPPLALPRPVDLPAPAEGAFVREVLPDSRLLFRFSALTFNAHRIHYDRQYAMEEEGYPGLVVHGPLTAMLLLQLARRKTSQTVVAFRFRGQSPLFDGAPFRLVGLPADGRVELEAQGPDGKTAMLATAEFA